MEKIVTLLEVVSIGLNVVGVIIVALFFAKLEPEGRFILMKNIRGGAIFMGLQNTGKIKLYDVKARGDSLRSGQKGFFFLSRLIKSPDDDANPEKAKAYNETVKAKALLGNHPLFLGSVSASCASTPKLLLAIQKAVDFKYREVEKFLRRLEQVYAEGVTVVDLVHDLDINNLATYLKISFTEQNADEIYADGYLDGIESVRTNDKTLTYLVIGMAICLVVVTAIIAYKIL